VIRLANGIGDVPVGGTLALVADDPAAAPDVEAWCRMRGHEYAGQSVTPDGIAVYLVRRVL
jgi:TusA-related sulfurtransferase